MPTLGSTIRKLRKAKGLTQRVLADQVGINYTYLSKIENDKLPQRQSPKEETLESLARSLDADFEGLCFLAGKVPGSLSQRMLKRPEFFRRAAWLDDETLGKLLQGLDADKKLDAEAALSRASDFLQGVLDSLTTHIAVLDEVGTIVAVNATWRAFALENDCCDKTGGLGTNYLAVCDAAVGPSSEGAKAVSKNIRGVLSGKTATYEIEYPCHSPNKQRWFLLRVSRFEHYGDVRIVTAHDDVTSRKLATMRRKRKTG